MKPFYPIASLLLIASCTGIRKQQPVFFTADESVFADTAHTPRSIHYDEPFDLDGNFTNAINLEMGKRSKVLIDRPTFFRAYGDVLLYPGENILVKDEHYTYSYEVVNGPAERNEELLFLKKYNDQRQPCHFPLNNSASLSDILGWEQQFLQSLSRQQKKAQALFDSLLRRTHSSDQFRQMTKDYVRDQYQFSPFYFYYYYKDTLIAHGLYHTRLKGLIPLYERKTKPSAVSMTYNHSLNELAEQLCYPYKISRAKTQTELMVAFDTIAANFNNFPREYLLSQLLLRAYSFGLEVPSKYKKLYGRWNNDKDLRLEVRKARKQRRFVDGLVAKNSTELLLRPDGKSTVSLEQLLKLHLGKVVLLDFWASWCMPCREQMPAIRKLSEHFVDSGLVVLKLSIERHLNPWKQVVTSWQEEQQAHYLFLKSVDSKFVEKYQIQTIPRYMLINKKGELVFSEAPVPSDPILARIISEMLRE